MVPAQRGTASKVPEVPETVHAMKTVTERFWIKVDRQGPDDCWLWIAFCYAPDMLRPMRIRHRMAHEADTAAGDAVVGLAETLILRKRDAIGYRRKLLHEGTPHYDPGRGSAVGARDADGRDAIVCSPLLGLRD